MFPGIAIVLIVFGITLVGESLNDLADPRLRARKSAGEVVGSIEDTSVDPNEKPTARNEVIANSTRTSTRRPPSPTMTRPSSPPNGPARASRKARSER